MTSMLTLAVVLLALLALPMALIAMWVRVSSPGPAIYWSQRVGRGNGLFPMPKFRSMRTDTPAVATHLLGDPASYLTSAGRFLRQTSLDELPQLWSVLRGDMSFVGPRPERPEFVCELEQRIPYYRERHTVKPGITGWAQLCYPYGSSEKDTIEKLQYDLYYVKNRSVLFDLVILVQTVEVVLWGKGAR